MDWIAWIRGSLSAALQWFEAHPGTAAWLGALGSIGAIIFVYLFALLQNRRFRSHESKPAPPDEIIHLLDQLYILGVAGGLILQMVAALQANQRSELAANANETARSSYNSIVRQRLSYALRYCDDAISALLRLTRTRTV